MTIVPDGNKFAMLALTNCATDVDSEQTLPRGTVALPGAQNLLDSQWREWLGTLESRQVEQTNLALLRHAPSSHPDLLDNENQELLQEVTDVYALLQLSGITYYEYAVTLTGTAE